MPSFSFTVPVKVTKTKTNSSVSKYEIITHNVNGVVIINLRGEYKVLCDNVQYDIAVENYSCKGVTEIYEQTLVDDLSRVRHIRSERDRDDRDRNMYLPFTAGCSVKGNIVKQHTGTNLIFKIKKVYLDLNNDIARKAIKFYRDNYVVIRLAIGSNFIDNYVPQPDQEIVFDENANVVKMPELNFGINKGFHFNTVKNDK